MTNRQKAARREACVTCICGLCAALFRCFEVDVTGGILPKSVAAFRIFGHHGFVCPLCGGTRAFALVSIGDFETALHCSLLGACAAVWLYLTLPIRLLVWAVPEHVGLRDLYFGVKRVESGDILMIAMAGFMCVQLWMHYARGFYWIPLEQLGEVVN